MDKYSFIGATLGAASGVFVTSRVGLFSSLVRGGTAGLGLGAIAAVLEKYYHTNW